MPIVRFDARECDDVLGDADRFHHFSIRDLDDGAELVQAWHDRGALIAIQLKGRASAYAFLRKASEAYGAQPEHGKFQFFDQRSGTHELRDVAYWRGDGVTAFVWTAGSAPTLLLWSNAAMLERGAELDTARDAPMRAASAEAHARENATKF